MAAAREATRVLSRVACRVALQEVAAPRVSLPSPPDAALDELVAVAAAVAERGVLALVAGARRHARGCKHRERRRMVRLVVYKV